MNMQVEPIYDVAKRVLDKVYEWAENPLDDGEVRYMPTGFYPLDMMTGGLESDSYMIVAGRPSMGKSALLFQMAMNVAAANGTVAIFSLEMSAEQVVQRMACNISSVNWQEVKRGTLSDESYPRLQDAISTISRLPMFIWDKPGITTAQMHKIALSIPKISMVVTDRLSYFGNKGENENLRISSISRGHKYLAKEHGVPVIAIAQLSRSVEHRSDKRPLMSDLRDSGSIEQDADIIVLLYRDDYYNENSDRPGVAELLVRKNRNGATGIVELGFRKETTTFRRIERNQICL